MKTVKAMVSDVAKALKAKSFAFKPFVDEPKWFFRTQKINGTFVCLLADCDEDGHFEIYSFKPMKTPGSNHYIRAWSNTKSWDVAKRAFVKACLYHLA